MLLVAAIAFVAVAGGEAAQTVTVVDLTAVKAVPDQLAVQACAGLFNRNSAAAGATAAYAIQSPYDIAWLADTDGFVNPPLTPVSQFLRGCH